jgi:hypothetical protein
LGRAPGPGRRRAHLRDGDRSDTNRRHLPDLRHDRSFPKPGTVTTVAVDKKSFKAAPARVTLKDIRIKDDGCVGQSFLRSYATLTSTTTDTDDVAAYYGVTKAV